MHRCSSLLVLLSPIVCRYVFLFFQFLLFFHLHLRRLPFVEIVQEPVTFLSNPGPSFPSNPRILIKRRQIPVQHNPTKIRAIAGSIYPTEILLFNNGLLTSIARQPYLSCVASGLCSHSLLHYGSLHLDSGPREEADTRHVWSGQAARSPRRPLSIAGQLVAQPLTSTCLTFQTAFPIFHLCKFRHIDWLHLTARPRVLHPKTLQLRRIFTEIEDCR